MTNSRWKEYQASSLADFIAVAELPEFTGGWIFRGQGDVGWPLIPKVDRTPLSAGRCLRLAEEAMLREFTLRARPHLKREPADDWEWLAIAQHHGVPTRLLDWTWNPQTALYFATDPEECPASDGVVWCFYKDGGAPLTGTPFNHPAIATYEPPHISPRIVAQRGLFTSHPPLWTGWDWFEVFQAQGGSLVAIRIPAIAKPSVHGSLVRMGSDSAALFPDLSGLGEFLQKEWTWTPYREFSLTVAQENEKVVSKDGRGVGHIVSGRVDASGRITMLDVAWTVNLQGEAVEPLERKSVNAADVTLIGNASFRERVQRARDKARGSGS